MMACFKIFHMQIWKKAWQSPLIAVKNIMILLFIGFITVLQNEDITIINDSKLLVPSFVNSNDDPNDICEIPLGYDTYIKYYPKLERSEEYVNIMYYISYIDLLYAKLIVNHNCLIAVLLERL